MRRTRIAVRLVSALVLAAPTSARVYQRKVDGEVRFQDSPGAAGEDSKVLGQFADNARADCYQVTERGGESYQVEEVWTSKQDNQGMFHLQDEGRPTTIQSSSIRSIVLAERVDNCARGELTRGDGRRTNALICNVINVSSAQDVKQLAPPDVASITACGG